MKKLNYLGLAALLGLSLTTTSCSSLSKSAIGSDLTNIARGVFSTSQISVSDLAGTWQIKGSSVAFKSENLLQQAGGMVAAAEIERRLNSELSKAGLLGGTIQITKDGAVTISASNLTLNGTLTAVSSSDYNFKITLKALGVSVGSMNVFIQQSPQTMDIMFDSAGLTKILSAVGTVTGNTTITAVTQLLEGYDGIYAGFSTKLVSSATDQQTSSGSTLIDILNQVGK